MSNSNTRRNIESLTISQLLGALKPKQLWAVIVIVFGLLSGSFGLGYKLNNLVTDAKIAKYESEIGGMRTKLKEFRGLQTKERFLGLYLRYLLARGTDAGAPSAATKGALEEASYNLHTYIRKLLDRGEEAKDEIDLRGLFLGKGGGREATVKFGYDGSVWPVPPEFGFAAER